MCLGIPGRVIGLLEGYHGQLALVDVQGAERKINIGLLEDGVSAGDWVVIHMGFAVERVTEAGAGEALAGLELVGRARARRVRRRFEVAGLVQGVGFRPFVYVTATELQLSGLVRNDSNGLVAEVEGDPDQVAAFGRRLRDDAPPLAVVESVSAAEVDLVGGTGFTIVESQHTEGGRTLASPDVATCDDCLDELGDDHDRRYRHPFITCTNCGPRFTIIEHLPYDRPATTMADYEMCPTCRSEYEDPIDRRFHAQPIACPACGPRLEYADDDGSIHGDSEALAYARYRLSSGAILAVKGIGGYHLVCDATNEDAVAELRRRKQRGNKPFAIMVPTIDAARELVDLSASEERLLADRRRPIVLLRRRQGGRAALGIEVAASVAPDTDELGILLPYSGLHVLLLGLPDDPPGPGVLVMTSGNRGGEPIVTDDADARSRLWPLVDGFLLHGRRIHVPCDDSVARVVSGMELPVRRSRGYAPQPLTLPFPVAPTLAVGADLKNTCAVAEGRQVWLSQHVGDMDDLATLDAFERTETQLERLTGVRPEMLVCDEHPGYRSTQWAESARGARPLVAVQHHHAHIASVLGEHGLDGSSPVIGFAFDGTGYGPDGTVWGGEVLLADYKGFRRLAHLAPVGLPGGDASIARPYRMALSHLFSAGVEWSEDLPCVRACPQAERTVLEHQLRTGFGTVRTSSMGRLFDAVSSLIGLKHIATYEAEAAMALEQVASPTLDSAAYAFTVADDPVSGCRSFDAAPVIRSIVDDLRAGVAVSTVGARFHAAVVDIVVRLATELTDELAGELDKETGKTVALGGGVFQNALLLTWSRKRLEAAGIRALVPHRLPPNDGGIALGQILVAAAR